MTDQSVYKDGYGLADNLSAMRQDIADMEAGIKEIQHRIKSIPSEIRQQVSSPNERVRIARYLYWHVPEIPVSAIANGLLDVSPHKARRLIGSEPLAIYCDRCNGAISFSSRSELQQLLNSTKTGRPRYAEGYTKICKPCWSDVLNEREISRKYLARQQSARLAELKSMPYRQYLASPEWKSTRRRHLQSSGRRCQVCNTKERPLDVHHRTYARRGEEHYKDLITLCRGCHSLFHANSKVDNK